MMFYIENTDKTARLKMINILFADGFEEVEALTVVDMARRANINVEMISLNDDLFVTGSHGITVKCDKLLNDAQLLEGIVLPGGIPGVPNIEKNELAVKLIKEHNAKGKLVAAICAAPTLLGREGMLSDSVAVCYPDMMGQLICKEKGNLKVITDKNIITSQSAGTAMEFAFEIIKYLKDENTAENVKKSIYY